MLEVTMYSTTTCPYCRNAIDQVLNPRMAG